MANPRRPPKLFICHDCGEKLQRTKHEQIKHLASLHSMLKHRGEKVFIAIYIPDSKPRESPKVRTRG